MACIIKKGIEVQPVITPYKNSIMEGRNAILITTEPIDFQNIWGCGLFQNVLFLYRLYEVAGYTPYLFMGAKPAAESDFSKKFRTMDVKEWNMKPFPIYAFIEMGVSCSPQMRSIFRQCGAKIFKLKLGNDLNGATENSIFKKRVGDAIGYDAGNVDTMLISPHYDLQQEYVSVINKNYPCVKIAPYVWEPTLIHEMADIHVWSKTGPYSFTIMEPNISFQKCSLVPIMICEAFYRQKPELMDGVAIINGDVLKKSVFCNESIFPNLDLYNKNKIHLLPRNTVKAVAKTLNRNIVIFHTVNNEYNYMFLEYLYMGFPVVHNYKRLKDYGYYYEGNGILEGAKMVETLIRTHGSNLELYKAKCRQLIWNFSIYNPNNITGWKNILDCEYNPPIAKSLQTLMANEIKITPKNSVEFANDCKKKIAFCFLIYDIINHEELWHNFFKNVDRSKYNIYIHYKTDKQLKYFEKYKLRKCINTKYEDYTIPMAYNLLFREAFDKDTANYKFIIVSGSCIPLKSFSHVYDKLTENNYGYFNNCPQDQCFPMCNPLLKFVERKYVSKIHNWFILNRNLVKELCFERDCLLPILYKDVYAPAEFYYYTFIKVLQLENEVIATNNLSNDATTFVNWCGMDYKYPTNEKLKNYKSISEDELIYLVNSKCLFGRKFNKECNVSLNNSKYLRAISSD